VAHLGTWPDFPGIRNRRPYGVEFSGWCHGAPGIGMARIGGLGVVDDAGIRHDIAAALRTTSACEFSPLDHACCGNFGRAEALFLGGRILSMPEYEKQALSLTQRAVDRARATGHYGLGWDSGLYIPSFHQGMSGIGYQLLRFAEPEQIPCALLWQ
jgi:lantibiotic modifying enzyme